MLSVIALTLSLGNLRSMNDLTVRLEDLDLVNIRQSVGVSRKNKSTDDHPLIVAGKTFDHGVGTHAESYFRVRLNGRAKSFSGLVGINDDAPNFWGTGIKFWIEGDGKILAQSRPIRRRQPAQRIQADLTGVKVATFVAAASGFGVVGDNADWLDGQITYVGAQPISERLPDEEAIILTPPPVLRPRLTGPVVFGVRQGNPVVFSLTASGAKPASFEVAGLPSWLHLDPSTGRLSGTAGPQGDYSLDVTVTNKAGKARRTVTVKVGEQIALTPPMGWNSWNSWGWNVTQDQVLTSAKVIARDLRDHGWSYVNIDDTWQGRRGGALDSIQPNRKFPDMKGLVDSIHGLGLSAGIYSTPWMVSYAGHIGGSSDAANGTDEWLSNADATDQIENAGRFQHFGKVDFTASDVKQFAEWGFDYLKYDWNPIDIPHTETAFQLMRDCGRDIVFSLSNSARFEDADGLGKYSQLWRTSGDLSDTWGAIRGNAFELGRWAQFQGPGHWNDEDMLVVGRVSLGDAMHLTRLTPNEQYLHISQWCLLGSPLLIGCDLEKADPFTMGLLTNDEVLEVDQDPLGIMATRVRHSDAEEVWAKPLADGSWAVGLYNVSEDPKLMSISWSELGITGDWTIRNLWSQRNVGRSSKQFQARVGRHGVILVRLSKSRR